MAENSIVGKIHSVACKDFVTYNEVIIYADEYLNIIIGPNGTGKSTIIAAIILGLGGAPKILSRSSEIHDYIKNGRTKAWIEIQIYRDTRKRLIKFERTIEHNKSQYQVDGKLVPVKEYLLLVAQYNIQINNLCQFLPQDRVQDFAKMNPKEILLSTLSSVCSLDLLTQFEKLKELSNESVNSKSQINSIYEKLKDAEKRNSHLRKQIDRMNARRTLQKEISICQRKQIWLKYDAMKNDLNTIQEELNEAKRFYERDEKHFNRIKSKSLNIIKQSNEFTNLIKNEQNNCKTFSERLSELTNECGTLENKIKTAKRNLESKKVEMNEKDAELSNENKVLEGLVQDLKDAIADLGNEIDRKARFQSIQIKLNELISQNEKLMKERIRINRVLDDDYTPQLQALKNKKLALKNVNERKLNFLREKYEDVYRAIMWLRNNRDLFQGKIYEPMLLEIAITNPEYAKYLENIVGMRDFLAFTCENKSDIDLLIRHLCNEQNLQVNVVHSDAANKCEFTSVDDIRKYKTIGFITYLLDVVHAPFPILNYLCKAYSIHKILIGSNKVSSNLDNIPKHISLFFAGDCKYKITFSKYSGDSSTMQTEISSKNLLSAGPDKRQLELLESELQKITINSDELKNERTEIERKLSIIQERRNTISDEKNQLEQKQRVVDQQKYHVERQTQKIKKLESNVIDIDEEENKFIGLAKQLVKSIFLKQQEKIICLKQYQQAFEKHELIYAKSNVFKKENNAVAKEVSDAKVACENSKTLVDTIQDNYDTKASKATVTLTKLKADCNGKDPNHADFPFKIEFLNLPNELNELKNVIYELESKVNCMLADDQKVIDEYEHRETEIEELRAKVERSNSNQIGLITAIKTLHNIWYPKVQSIVDTINRTFGSLMSSMSYVGEIELSRTEEADYNSYGIQIAVQFRNNSRLQVLDRFVQSGGERAVAIAVYTLSLQKITHVPFRCVDEINQGMDERNERKFIEMLVSETAQPNQSQYFFVTPKLIPNMPHNEYMTFHVVYNGLVDDHNMFNRH